MAHGFVCHISISVTQHTWILHETDVTKYATILTKRGILVVLTWHFSYFVDNDRIQMSLQCQKAAEVGSDIQ